MTSQTRKKSLVPRRIVRRWQRFWMRFSSTSSFGKIATRLAVWSAPPHYRRESLAHIRGKGYISFSATIFHNDLQRGKSVFIDDRCMIYQNTDGGRVQLGDEVKIYRDTIIETGQGGYLEMGEYSSIHPRCQLNAYSQPIVIGKHVMIAANTSIYSYDHNVLPDQPIHKQDISSKGPVVIDDESWIGTGVIILNGVHIGKGAVVGAGSVVVKDIPDGAIAVGNPARVVKYRKDLSA